LKTNRLTDTKDSVRQLRFDSVRFGQDSVKHKATKSKFGQDSVGKILTQGQKWPKKTFVHLFETLVLMA
jgi:hypothetical protein